MITIVPVQEVGVGTILPVWDEGKTRVVNFITVTRVDATDPAVLVWTFDNGVVSDVPINEEVEVYLPI